MPSNVRLKGSGSSNRAPPVTPMSERQQMALLMQMTSSSESGSRSPSSGSRSRDRNERGETPLHLAAIKGDVEQVCRLLAHRADPNVADFAGWTPLHEACNHGWYDVAFRLVHAGANVNAKGLDNDTPLHDAVINGHLKLIKLLVEKGADINAKNSKGKTPLDIASASVQPYLLNHNLPLPESGSTTSSRAQPRSRDEKKVTSSEKQKSGSASTSSSDMENKTSSAAADDVYEFKSVKETDSSPDKNADGGDSEIEPTDPLSIVTNANEDSSKRAYSEFENNEENEKDEENKRKRRKEDGGKESGKANQRSTGQGKGQNNKQTSGGTGKSAGSSAKSSSSTPTDKKSPVSSPKPNVSSSSDAEVDGSSTSADGKTTDLKVPPLKIVIPQSSANEQDTNTSRNGKNNSQRTHQALPYIVASSNNDSTENDGTTGSNDQESNSTSKESEKKDASNGQNDEQATQNSETEPSTSNNSNTVMPVQPSVELHPRKRKMKQSREQANSQAQTTEHQESTSETREVHPHEQPITNCYKLFMNIRKQIEKRRKGLYLVQPKPPQGFNHYLMNRCTYVLENTAPTTPNINYPPTLPQQMKDLFAEQEKERYRLRMQHVIEKEKLVLSVEQEILRVHGKAVRTLHNQPLPYSVCTILRDEEVYNLITPEQEEKDRVARARFNGRLFLSWLQDVDDKWEKIKEHMLLRHHHEAESLHAVQKMNWEWKLKELSLCDKKSTPKIDKVHVPEVHVSDDFNLLPA
ncbi:ankyrin repeat domain-containing protein 12 isoform X4 [Sitophilus oryzae]|uniref:Ankyrin repeat domain-containing protein 12 isoform X4 n=1 Tax=Sitophilus oryzae TaxID=7048 RepID=A0A6J2YBF1_SITOR|nr:ankyrin repeat domain-containing protein 12 isoform X4 [Sitophilus oryzae]